MKKILHSIIPLSLVFIFCVGSCKRQSNSPTNQLPPLTTKGLNTFGCLVNGKIFVPQRPVGDITPFLTCTYQYLYADTSKPYSFVVTGTNKINSCNQQVVIIGLDSIKLNQGNTYYL